MSCRPPARRLLLAIQQMVAIARALDIHAKVLMLDEPTTSLDERRSRALRRHGKLRDPGSGLFVTHFLDQVYAVADQITVLRNGALVGEYPPRPCPDWSSSARWSGASCPPSRRGRQPTDSAPPAAAPFVAAAGSPARR